MSKEVQEVITIKPNQITPEHVGKLVSIDFSWNGAPVEGGEPNPAEAYSYQQVGILLGFRDDRSSRRDISKKWPVYGDPGYKIEVALQGYPDLIDVFEGTDIRVYL